MQLEAIVNTSTTLLVNSFLAIYIIFGLVRYLFRLAYFAFFFK